MGNVPVWFVKNRIIFTESVTINEENSLNIEGCQQGNKLLPCYILSKNATLCMISNR